MQRTGRQELALRLRDEGPSAAAGYAVRSERSANQWLVWTGHAPEFVFKPIAGVGMSGQVQRAPTPLAKKAFAPATRETGVTSAELRRVDHTIGWKAYLQRMGGTYGYAFRMSKDRNITRYWLTGGPP